MAGALSGVRVLDFTHTLAGFLGTLIMADLGADVLKVEPPTGNVLRQDEPLVQGESARFMALNRGKRSIVLDLKHPAGRRIAQELAARSDVVVSNFRSTVMDALGLGYETLRAGNPRLIYAAVSGFGTSGPYRERAAYDPTIQAMSGVMSVTGERDGPPTLCGVPLGDLASGSYLAQGIVTALYARERTGEGQRVDLAMLDVLLFFLTSYHGPVYLAVGQEYERTGNRHPFIAPYGAYETADGYVVLVGRTDDQFARLCRAIGAEDWVNDERFASAQARLAHGDELNRLLCKRLRARPRAVWMATFDAHGVPAAPVNTVGEVLSDPVIRARAVIEHAHPRGGRVANVANPLRFERTPAGQPGASPLFAQHTSAVLRDLGYSDAEIARLATEGAVLLAPESPR